jgi:hypothetical protein
MSRLRAWWRRRQRRPFDWASECPELFEPAYVRRIAPYGPARSVGRSR